MEPPYVEDLRRIRQMRDQHHEEFVTTHLRDLRRIRWYLLGLNLVFAASYLIPPDQIGRVFHRPVPHGCRYQHLRVHHQDLQEASPRIYDLKIDTSTIAP